MNANVVGMKPLMTVQVEASHVMPTLGGSPLVGTCLALQSLALTSSLARGASGAIRDIVLRLRPSKGVSVAVIGVVLGLIMFPEPLWAWTPGTHVFLGDALLRNLNLLPPTIAELLAAFPSDFLYGSIAADTSIAKKYAEVGRHCHSWRIGLEIHDEADEPQLRAFSLGYLAHLAADVVAHNFFVPRQLAVTSSTTALGHSYWESRIDTHLGDPWPRRARDLLFLDHSRADGHLDRILSPTLFGTPTNRRIFRGMVYVTDTDSWQRIFQLVSENSRWDLSDAEVGKYMTRSFDYIVDMLSLWDRSEAFAFDPSGDEPLRTAKKVRRLAKRQGGDVRAALKADRMFGMPATELRHAANLKEPLFSPRVPKEAD